MNCQTSGTRRSLDIFNRNGVRDKYLKRPLKLTFQTKNLRTLNLSNPHVRIVYSAVQTVQIVVKLVIEVLEVKFLGQIPPPLNVQGSRGKTFTRFYQYYC